MPFIFYLVASTLSFLTIQFLSINSLLQCWDQVVANHARSDVIGRNGRKVGASCSMCKDVAKGFVNVFLDLGEWNEDGPVETPTTKNDGKLASENVYGNDTLDNLTEEWDSLWRELEILCGCTSSRSNDKSENIVNQSVRANNNIDGGIEVINIDDDFGGGEQDIANIVRATLFTQSRPDPTPQPAQSLKNNKTPARHLPAWLCYSQFEDEPADLKDEDIQHQSQDTQQQQKQKIFLILERLHEIHESLIAFQSTNCINSSSSKSLQNIKRKIIHLQSTTSDLRKENQSIQSQNDQLKSQLTKTTQHALVTTLECEREKTKLGKLQTKYDNLQSTYHNHEMKSQIEINLLQDSNSKLQKHNKSLQDKVFLNDVKEIEEISLKYRKVTQELHDFKKTYISLQTKFDKAKQEFERKLEREKVRGDERVKLTKEEMNSKLMERMDRLLVKNGFKKRKVEDKQSSEYAEGRSNAFGGATIESSHQQGGYVANHRASASESKMHVAKVSALSRQHRKPLEALEMSSKNDRLSHQHMHHHHTQSRGSLIASHDIRIANTSDFRQNDQMAEDDDDDDDSLEFAESIPTTTLLMRTDLSHSSKRQRVNITPFDSGNGRQHDEGMGTIAINENKECTVQRNTMNQSHFDVITINESTLGRTKNVLRSHQSHQLHRVQISKPRTQHQLQGQHSTKGKPLATIQPLRPTKQQKEKTSTSISSLPASLERSRPQQDIRSHFTKPSINLGK